MKTTKSISDERLREIAAIIPDVDEEAPEITPAQAARARLAHESHPQWYRITPVKQQICIKIDKDVLDACLTISQNTACSISAAHRQR